MLQTFILNKYVISQSNDIAILLINVQKMNKRINISLWLIYRDFQLNLPSHVSSFQNKHLCYFITANLVFRFKRIWFCFISVIHVLRVCNENTELRDRLINKKRTDKYKTVSSLTDSPFCTGPLGSCSWF